MKRTKIAAMLFAASLALGTYAGGVASSPTAQADDGNVAATSYQTFKNQEFNGCMDDKSGKLWLRDCHTGKNQKWEVRNIGLGDNLVSLENAETGDCLVDDHGLGTDYCLGGSIRNFKVKHWNDGTIRFQNEGTGQCVDVDSDGDIGTRKCDKSKSQSWS